MASDPIDRHGVFYNEREHQGQQDDLVPGIPEKGPPGIGSGRLADCRRSSAGLTVGPDGECPVSIPVIDSPAEETITRYPASIVVI